MDDFTTLVNKGADLAEVGNHEDALVCFDKALAIKPDHPHVLFNKGLSFSELG